MDYFSTATNIVQQPEKPLLALKPFVMPQKQEGETEIEYVTTIKPDAHIDYFVAGGVDFHKRFWPDEASLTINQGRYFPELIPCRLFTQKQADALKERLAETTIVIAAHERRDAKEPEKTTFFKQQECKASDLVIFVPKSEYNSNPAFMQQFVAQQLAAKENQAAIDKSSEDFEQKFEQETNAKKKKG